MIFLSPNFGVETFIDQLSGRRLPFPEEIPFEGQSVFLVTIQSENERQGVSSALCPKAGHFMTIFFALIIRKKMPFAALHS